MKTVVELCTPAESTLSSSMDDTVANLRDLVEEKINADLFFSRETHTTVGLKQLLTQVFDRLDGRSPQGVFRLKQAMGGGKTHSLIAAGLLAKRPLLRRQVLATLGRPDVSSDAMRVVAFDGRTTDSKDSFWVRLFKDLEPNQAKWAGAVADIPGPATWGEIIGTTPTLILLDELPPYLFAMSTKSAGAGTEADRVVLALANLMAAVMAAGGANGSGRCCLIITDLEASWERGSQHVDGAFATAFQEAVRMGTAETKRVVVDIVPVRVDNAELAAILRKRLFTTAPDPDTFSADVAEVKSAYKTAYATAVQQGVMSEVDAAAWTGAMQSTYPFHPGLLDLMGRFKENEGFQQTREILRLARRLVARAYDPANPAKPYLLHPHDFDFGDAASLALLDGIQPKLTEARRVDVSNHGSGKAEVLSEQSGSPIFQEVARLVFMASLATSAKAVNGLRDDEAGGYLAAPGRDVSGVKNVLLRLADDSWYLHRRVDHRWYYRDVRNVNSMIRDRANDMQADMRLEEVKARLAMFYEPFPDKGGRDAYQKVVVFPKPEDIQLDHGTTVLVIANGTDGAIPAPYQQVWRNTAWQNRVLFLTANSRFADLPQNAALLASAQAVQKEFASDGQDNRSVEVEQANTAVERYTLLFRSAVQQVFLTLRYPDDGDLAQVSVMPEIIDSKFRGDLAIRGALLTNGKFKDEAFTNSDAFYGEFMHVRFPLQEMVWKEILESAARDSNWYMVKPGTYEALKARSLAKGLWRDLPQEGKVRKGPFPKEKTSVSISCERDELTGSCKLTVTANYGDRVHYEFGSTNATTASPLVPAGGLTTSAMRMRFLAIDSTGEHDPGPVKLWENKLTLRGDFRFEDGAHRLVLRSAPGGATMRYTTNGANPKNGGVYDGEVRVPPLAVVLAIAESDGIWSDELRLKAPGDGPEEWPDPSRPLVWLAFPKRVDRTSTFEALTLLKRHRAILQGAKVRMRSTENEAERYFDLLSGAKLTATPDDLEAMVLGLPAPFRDGLDIALEIARVGLQTGATFKILVQELGLDLATLDRTKVLQ